jgi:hypothetical protein
MNRQAKELTKAMLSTIASLVLSVKNIVIEYQTKLFPFAKAFLGLCLSGLLIVSCASGQRMAGNIELISRGTNCQWLISRFSTIDGQDALDYWSIDPKVNANGYRIPQGNRNVEVWVEWSNQFRDYIQLPFDVKEGRSYVVYAMELQTGQDPTELMPCLVNETSEYMRRKSTEKWVGLVGAALTYPIPIFPAVALPISLIFELSKKPNKEVDQDKIAIVSQPADTPPPVPTARPYDGCCYVWIEDADTREVVAGTRLPVAGK